MSHVCTAASRPVVSQVQVPPVVSGGYVHTSRGHITSRAYISASRMYIPTFGAYIPTYGVSHGTSHAMTYGPYYGPQYGQGSSPYGCRYQQSAYSPNYGFVSLNSQGTPHYGASMPPYTGQIGGGNYGQGLGGYGNQTYANQNYQGAVHRSNHPMIPFLTTMNIPDLLRLTNDHVSHDPAWLAVPTKLPSNIPKFEGNLREDLSEHVTTFHLWCSLNFSH